MCLVGFLLARVIVVKRLARVPAADPTPMEKEADSAYQSR